MLQVTLGENTPLFVSARPELVTPALRNLDVFCIPEHRVHMR
ncbi:hypothetical protein [Photorhabdus laumondii]